MMKIKNLIKYHFDNLHLFVAPFSLGFLVLLSWSEPFFLIGVLVWIYLYYASKKQAEIRGGK